MIAQTMLRLRWSVVVGAVAAVLAPSGGGPAVE